MKSSIIDVPRKHNQEDLFGIKVYQDALVKYVRHTDVMEFYAATHAGCTLADVHQAFFVKKNMHTLFMSESMYLDFWENDQKKLGFFKDKDKLKDTDFITVADCRFLISTNWPTTVQGSPGLFLQFLDVCKKLGISIQSC